MITCRRRAPQLGIQLERKPGQGVPVVGVAGREGPPDALGAQPLTDVGVVGDILVIVDIEELEAAPKDRRVSG